MFIAMNRFKVVPGAQAEFEQVWTTRDSHLGEVPGFVAFHLLRGPERDDHVLYSSHTLWRSRADFEPGPGPRRSAVRTRTRVRTGRSISATPNSKGSRSSRPWNHSPPLNRLRQT